MVRRKGEGIFYIMPSFIILFCLTIMPLVYSIYMSLFDIRGWDLSKASFIGLTNYLRVLTDPIFLNSLKFTTLYTFFSLIIELGIGILLAFFINELSYKLRIGTKIITILILVPILLPGVATATIYSYMLSDLNGVIPHLINSLFNANVSMLSNPFSATLTLIITDVWQWSPFFFLLIYSGLKMLPKDVLDAARVDGAGVWRVLTAIALPMVRFIITIAVVLRGIFLFRSFAVPRVMTQGGPGTATRTISLHIYQYAFKAGRIGYAAATTFIVFILINLVVLFYFQYLGRQQKGTV